MREIQEPIIVEQTFEAPINKVWKSITDIDQMRQWYFENIPSFESKVGFETQFNVRSKDRNFFHIWKVTEVVPMKRLSYDWKYDGYQGDSSVLFELFKQSDSTKLRLTHMVTEKFPEDIPEFTRDSGVAGWEYFIKQSLKKYLEEQ